MLKSSEKRELKWNSNYLLGKHRIFFYRVKDGQELPDDSRIRSTTSPGGDVALTIDPVKPEDAGNYSLVAANDEGECRTTVPVTVNRKSHNYIRRVENRRRVR